MPRISISQWLLRALLALAFALGMSGACLAEPQMGVPAFPRPPMRAVKDLPVQTAMPDPLVFADGRKVTTAARWRERREEMKRILEEYEFGHAPPSPGNVTGKEVSSKLLQDGAVKYRLVHLTFGPGERLGFDIGMFSPMSSNAASTSARPLTPALSPGGGEGEGAKGERTNGAREVSALTPTDPGPPPHPSPLPQWGRGGGSEGKTAAYPTIVTLTFSSGENSLRQFSEPLRRGYAVVAIGYAQLGADNTNYRASAFFPSYPGYDWNDIAAWSWGLSRCVDFLQTDAATDGSRIIALGVSRLGQAVLHAGAFDDRIAMVAPVCAGCAFRFSGKGRGGRQGVDEIVDQNTYWFGPRFAEFRGQVDKLPFDQHWLLALAAPRAYLLCNPLDDQYGNAYAAAQSYLGAKPVYALLGAPDQLGQSFRPGQHGMQASDWTAVLDFADQKLGKVEINRRFDQLPSEEELRRNSQK